MEVTVLRFPAATGLLSSAPRFALDDFRIGSTWGVTFKPVELDPAFADGNPLSHIIDTTGDWWCAARGPAGSWLILADPFGMQPIYLATSATLDGEALFVGASSADVARAVRAAGGVLENDWSTLLTTIAAKHDFLDCVYDFSTPARGVRMVPPDQAVLVHAGGFALVPRPKSPDLTAASYEQLVDRGIARAMTDLRALASDFPNIAINLSGGKDSRVVLALALAAGLGNEISVLATDPTPSGSSIAALKTVAEDLAIASRIVKRYGLKWSERRIPRDTWPESLAGQIAVFQQHRRGLSHQFIPAGITYRLHEGEAKVNGAGGEIYRRYWSKVLSINPAWPSLDFGAEALERDAQRLFGVLTGPLEIPTEFRERAANRFSSAMRHLDRDNVRDALDRHYEFFRLRGHAGGRRWGLTYGILNHSVLLQPEFVQAVSMLSPEERFSGRMLFDIVERLAPELHDLEYQSGPWEFGGNRPPVFDWSSVRADESGYRASQQRIKASMIPSGYKGRPRPDMAPLIADGLAELSDSMQNDGLDSEILHPLRQSPPSDLRGQGRLVSRLSNWRSGFVDGGSFSASVGGPLPRVKTLRTEP